MVHTFRMQGAACKQHEAVKPARSCHEVWHSGMRDSATAQQATALGLQPIAWISSASNGTYAAGSRPPAAMHAPSSRRTSVRPVLQAGQAGLLSFPPLASLLLLLL